MRLIRTLFFILCATAAQSSYACPDLKNITIPVTESGWKSLHQKLRGIMNSCLRSSEYFALFGATQLKNGQLPEALESLERALMLNPENGSALIDYSEVLFRSGQVFAALELNTQLQTRKDLPDHLHAILQQRAQYWQSLTSQRSHRIGIQVGHDTNLNGAPNLDTVTLTLPDESLTLALSENSKEISGQYLKLHLSTQYQTLAPESDHRWYLAMNSRVSHDQQSDLLQLDGRYNYNLIQEEGRWDLGVNLSHLHYGGSALYRALGLTANYYLSGQRCEPYAGLALQYQLFPNQQEMDGLELKGGLGTRCVVWGQQFTSELHMLTNQAQDNQRPGNDRNGWEWKTQWQTRLSRGIFAGEVQITNLDDDTAYNPILANGATRSVKRQSVLLQYLYPLPKDTSFTLSLYHQRQRSNIELFQNRDTTLAFGITLSF